MTTRFSTANRTRDPTVATALLAELKGERIVNLGSGSQGLTRADTLVINVDHVPPASTRALDVRVIADLERLPFKDGVFDGVLIKDVLEHVNNPVMALAEAGRIARPGAVLILTVPRALPRAVWDDPTHIRGFTLHAVCTLMSLAGWDRIHQPRRMGGLPGAGRLGLSNKLELIMRVPVVGHWFGTNWIARGRRS